MHPTTTPRRADGRVPGTSIEWRARSTPGDFFAEFAQGGPDGISLDTVEELDSMIRTLQQIKAFAEAP